MRVLGQDADEAETTLDAAFERRIVGNVRIAAFLDMPAKPLQDFGGLDVGVGINGAHLDARAILPAVIDHLTDVLLQLIHHQARTIRVLAGLFDRFRPMVAIQERQILDVPAAVIVPCVLGDGEAITRFLELVFRLAHLRGGFLPLDLQAMSFPRSVHPAG